MEVFDLTNDEQTKTTKKRKNDGEAKAAAPKKKDKPHVLLWICSHGKGQGRVWTGKSLRVIGVYGSKQQAENKKEELMNKYDCFGHGDICVGGSCWDEIDLVVRAAEEVNI